MTYREWLAMFVGTWMYIGNCAAKADAHARGYLQRSGR